MPHRSAKADVVPVRQQNQYNCMTTSLCMALRALGVPGEECSIQQVNKVVGAMPLRGAAWEPLLAAANHYGMRATLTLPSTVLQLKKWTDAGSPIVIAWNPEGREWSHASLVFDVTEDDEHGFLVHVADPNIPDPDETVRVVPKKEFYGKWYEKSPQGFLIRRPACAIEREVTPEGRQVMANNKFPTPQTSAKRVLARWGRNSKTAAVLKDIWIVTDPAEWEEIVDIVTQISHPKKLGDVIRGMASRWDTDRPVLHDSESSAEKDAMRRLEKLHGRGSIPAWVLSHKGDYKLASVKRLVQAYTKEHTVEVTKINGPNATLKGSGHAALKAGITVPKRWLPSASLSVGDEFFATYTRDPRKPWEFSKMDFEMFASKVANRYQKRLDRKLKSLINRSFERIGLDGNSRFKTPQQGYSRAVDLMGEYGIELGDIPDPFDFKHRPTGSVRVDVAFTNQEDIFSPYAITNSMLIIQYTELRDDVFEVIAYMS